MARLKHFAVRLAVSAVVLGGGTAYAAEWRLVEVSGAVRVASPGATPVSASLNQALMTGTSITTASGARAVLTNGEQRIVMGPSSRMTVAPETGGGMTRVLEELGSILFQVDKKPSQHFRVETPLLAAVVKGTTFTVNVGIDADSVHVAEGLVEVRANNGGPATDIPAGVTGSVPRGDASSVTVIAPAPDVTQVAAEPVAPLDYGAVSEGLVDTPVPSGMQAAPPVTNASVVTTEAGPAADAPNGGAPSAVISAVATLAPPAAVAAVAAEAPAPAPVPSGAQPPAGPSGGVDLPQNGPSPVNPGAGRPQVEPGGPPPGLGPNGPIGPGASSLGGGQGSPGSGTGTGNGIPDPGGGNNAAGNSGPGNNNGNGNGNPGGGPTPGPDVPGTGGSGPGNSGNGNGNGNPGPGNNNGNGNGNAGSGSNGNGNGNSGPGNNGNGNGNAGSGNNGNSGRGNGNGGGVVTTVVDGLNGVLEGVDNTVTGVTGGNPGLGGLLGRGRL